LWPLLLVAWGLEGLFGRRSALGALLVVLITVGLGVGVVWYAINTGSLNTSPPATRPISQALNDAADADVTIDMSVGTLDIGALVDSPNLLEGTVSESDGLSADSTFKMVGNTAHYTLSSQSIGFLLFRGGSQWTLDLNGRVPLKLNIHHSVGDATIDLSDLELREASIDTSAGETTITIPDSGRSTIKIDHSVGALRVIVPEGMDARIRVDSGLGGVNIASRFQKVGEDVYETEGYAGADERVAIEIDHSVGELIVE